MEFQGVEGVRDCCEIGSIWAQDPYVLGGKNFWNSPDILTSCVVSRQDRVPERNSETSCSLLVKRPLRLMSKLSCNLLNFVGE